MNKIQPGTYRARVINYELSYNSKGNPQVEVLFGFDSSDGVHNNHHEIRWWGQLTGEKAVPYTLKTLALLGFRGKTDDDFTKLADGVEGGMLDIAAEVDLVLEERTVGDKTFMSIAFINDPNFKSGRAKNAMTRSEAKVKIGALNLAGQMAAIRASQPAKPAAPAKQTQAPTGGDDNDFDFGVI